MASFSYFALLGLTTANFIPGLLIPGTRSDFSGIWVEDSIYRENPGKLYSVEGIWALSGV